MSTVNPQTIRDLARLRWNLLLLIVCATVGAVTVIISLHFTKIAQTSERKAQAEQGEARARLARARDEEQDLRNKIERYRSLGERGIIGQEHRLDWIEQIRKIKQSRKLIDLQYEMAPQQEVDAVLLPGGDSAFSFMSSTMHVQMPLLHEEDLLNFLADLRSSIAAFIRVESCNVERTAADSGQTNAAQLRADCTLEWITLREKK